MSELEFSNEALQLACTSKEERDDNWWARFVECNKEQQALVVAHLLASECCDDEGMLLQSGGLPLPDILTRMLKRSVEHSWMHELLGILGSAKIVRSGTRPIVQLKPNQRKQLEDFRSARS